MSDHSGGPLEDIALSHASFPRVHYRGLTETLKKTGMFELKSAPSIMVLLSVLVAAALLVGAQADIAVYTDNALESGWEDWSWSSTLNYDATDIFEGTSSLSVSSQAWAAFSAYYEGNFSSYAGLKFDIAGAQPDVIVYFSDTNANVDSATLPLSTMSTTVTANAFTTILINFAELPGSGAPLGAGNWNRITWQGGANGATVGRRGQASRICLMSPLTVPS